MDLCAIEKIPLEKWDHKKNSDACLSRRSIKTSAVDFSKPGLLEGTLAWSKLKPAIIY